MTVRVKICGLTRKSDVECAIESGSDALGFIFGYRDSPRNLNFEKLKDLLSTVPPFVSTVVVSPASNPSLEKAVKIHPSFLQLYSGTGLKRGKEFTNVIQTIRPSGGDKSIIKHAILLSKHSKGILFDASSTSHYSRKNKKSSKPLEDQLIIARKIRDALVPFPFILGGGLNEENVANAVLTVKPNAVDVSSGVEIEPGIKDEKKIRRFIKNAKNAIG